MKPAPPEICDYECPHADFAPADTAGICRTMSAVWCRLLKALVNKNRPCEWRAQQPANSGKTANAAGTAPSRARTRRTRRKGP